MSDRRTVAQDVFADDGSSNIYDCNGGDGIFINKKDLSRTV